MPRHESALAARWQPLPGCGSNVRWLRITILSLSAAWPPKKRTRKWGVQVDSLAGRGGGRTGR